MIYTVKYESSDGETCVKDGYVIDAYPTLTVFDLLNINPCQKDPCSLFTYSFILSLLTQLGNDIIIYYVRTQEMNSTQVFPITNSTQSEWSSSDLQLNEVVCYLNAISISLIM
ncbi:16658_t:CDS:2 [Cetraspora pellucida]|uniref:16658_t:CDS:1 n=1 Tax=Cetraspora pellucida TaxID=1433469 RepID=A0A9N8YZL6_9GLOM|nr:16658_t:CDS:2 [Cetraspora pellucida]